MNKQNGTTNQMDFMVPPAAPGWDSIGDDMLGSLREITTPGWGSVKEM